MMWFWIVVLILIIVVIALVAWSWSYRGYRSARDDVNAAAVAAATLDTNFTAFQGSFAGLTAAIAAMTDIVGVSGSTQYTALLAAEAASSAYLPTIASDILAVRRRIHAAQSDLGSC
jgi:hypothetical protein